MSKIQKTPTMAATIADLQRRLATLEKAPMTSAGTKVLHADWGNFTTQTPLGGNAYRDVANGVSGAGGAGIASYKCVRPIPLLIIAQFVAASAAQTAAGFIYGFVVLRVAGGGATVFQGTNPVIYSTAVNNYGLLFMGIIVPAFGTGQAGQQVPVMTPGTSYECAMQFATDTSITSVNTGRTWVDVFALGG